MSKPPFLTLPPGARAYRLPTARGEFAVHDTGTARRGTALLLPGFTGSKEDFIGLLRPLADAGYRVVAVDGRGQYESPGPRTEEAYALPELARDVLAQVAALDVPGVHLVGHSFGGLVARAAVLRDPAPFRSLTLLSSGPAAVSEIQQERLKLLVGALAVLDMTEVWEHMRALDPPEAADAVTGPEVAAFLRTRWLATRRAQLSATGRTLLTEPDRVAELAAAGLPVHVLSGATDYAWPVPLLDAMAARLGARRTVIEGADHSPNAERPAATATALAAFFDAVSPGRTG
ncbi:alpha/beta hydrolase [Streptomyces sp. TRM70308]|uniref:alpha/beta fold hydrolase n=1 Tax=Streptomyces sp. TRM70308 TaxID=3131932 RepID=UPI003D00CE74